MRRSTWLDLLAGTEDRPQPLPRDIREALSDLDDRLFEIWNLGENVLLAWTHEGYELRFLSVRHYTIGETITRKPEDTSVGADFIKELLAGEKFLSPREYATACAAMGGSAHSVHVSFRAGSEVEIGLINSLVRRYGVSLVRDRAVVLLDAVQFSLHSPLEQVAMLNSLAYSVNSAYRQLLSKDIHINFARTTTGDGFYIWNRATTVDANTALYKMMMMILADNAVAQRKAQGPLVPRLRAAFHVGEHYEFYQVEALNPTTFSYIVGQVTIDLSRMIEKALPGQILLGDFQIEVTDAKTGRELRYETLDFVEKTAATLDQLNGLVIAGDHIENIRCYLTGQSLGGGRYPVNRYHIRDKHGTVRTVYNAKINIHRERAESIFLGVQHDHLPAFSAAQVDVLTRETSE
jgi:hypothetical protein